MAETENIAQTAARLAEQRMPSVEMIEGVPFLFFPDNWNHQSLEHLLPVPRRIRDKPRFNEPESFIGYIDEFHNLADTRPRYFANFENYQLLGVLNASAPDKPQHGDHIATLQMEKAREWLAWTEQAGKPMTGAKFARFLENHIDEIQGNFDGPMLLSMCRGLRIRTSAETNVDETISEGVRKLRLDENTSVKGAVGDAEFAFPETINVTLRVFQHVSAYQFTARLRWDKNDNNGIVFFYDLVDPVLIEQEAFKQVRKEIAESLHTTIYVGNPGKPA